MSIEGSVLYLYVTLYRYDMDDIIQNIIKINYFFRYMIFRVFRISAVSDDAGCDKLLSSYKSVYSHFQSSLLIYSY